MVKLYMCGQMLVKKERPKNKSERDETFSNECK